MRVNTAPAELVLELLHLLVHRGLGDRIGERTGSASVAAGASDPIEAFQSRELNHEAVLINLVKTNKYLVDAQHGSLEA